MHRSSLLVRTLPRAACATSSGKFAEKIDKANKVAPPPPLGRKKKVAAPPAKKDKAKPAKRLLLERPASPLSGLSRLFLYLKKIQYASR